ncbi:MAG: hypothetical protein PF487_14245 [Bacteroidales bacterium]|jgi:hypothetical protein|nr:hypothetical protein [Bacteroidales bacterium]
MPKVHKYILIFISAIMWSGIGLFLPRLALRWFTDLSINEIIFSIAGGILLGVAIAYFSFSDLAIKNINRIKKYQGKVSIWAFQKWPSYLLIAFMMSMGIYMRNSAFIPKIILCPIYIGFGLALFLTSFRYYQFLIKNKKKITIPKVKHNSLILITGIIWLIASIILTLRAYNWVVLLSTSQLIIGLITALVLSIIKIYFVFRKLTLKNIERIKLYKQKTISIWQFHILKDKLLIVLMILIGIALRSALFIPKYVLFPIYLGIGISMFYVWLLYLKTFYKGYK